MGSGCKRCLGLFLVCFEPRRLRLNFFLRTTHEDQSVCVIRNEGDTVNFFRLEMINTSRSFEVRNMTEIVTSFLSLSRVGKLETDCKSRQTLYSELASATAGTLIFVAQWRANMRLANQQLSTQVLNRTTESRPALKQLLRYLKGTHDTCLRLERHMPVQKKKQMI